MNARDLENAMLVASDVNDTLRGVDLDDVAQAAEAAADLADAARDADTTLAARAAEEAGLMSETAHRVQDLSQLQASNALDQATVNIPDLVARPFAITQHPPWLQAASSFVEAQQPLVMQFDGLLDGYQRAWDGISAATDAVGSIARAAEVLGQPMGMPFMSMLSSLGGPLQAAIDWRPILTRQSLLSEASYTAPWSESQQLTSLLSRPPAIWTAMEELHRSYVRPLQDVHAQLVAIHEIGSSLTLRIPDAPTINLPPWWPVIPERLEPESTDPPPPTQGRGVTAEVQAPAPMVTLTKEELQEIVARAIEQSKDPLVKTLIIAVATNIFAAVVVEGAVYVVRLYFNGC